jgi:hypothetical protein
MKAWTSLPVVLSRYLRLSRRLLRPAPRRRIRNRRRRGRPVLVLVLGRVSLHSRGVVMGGSRRTEVLDGTWPQVL